MIVKSGNLTKPGYSCLIFLFFFLNQAEDLLRREKNLEEAKKVVIKNDPSLPEPKCVSKIQCA